ncbi:MAG: TIGR01212 family radical SAM protein, partial [Candidatus Omnitrophica bacterium]|nr:TIGR01212 family radical SAM protein [Candidatus Omnitrophota bacterium]
MDIPICPYNKFGNYLKKHFGCRVHKVTLDAGFTCPNRDGYLSYDGCTYCNNQGFSSNTRLAPRSLEEQLAEGINYFRSRFNAEKFIAYFQAYTNTYAAPDELRKRYDVVRSFDEVAGISIGTRPDCVTPEILDLIESYSDKYMVWVEYGLQTIHEKTLKRINRGHTYESFLKAIDMTAGRKINICAHVILGLPGETRDDMMKTAEAV